MTGTEQHAHTLAFQGAVNRVMRALLRTPLLARLIGSRLVTLYVVGRKTGRRYVVPVAYSPHEGTLLFGTEFRWVRNLRTGEPSRSGSREGGGRRTSPSPPTRRVWWPTTATSPATTTSSPGSTASHFDAAGEPDPADLHRCWAAGARTVRLVPR